MELKQYKIEPISPGQVLLIVPYGIETTFCPG